MQDHQSFDFFVPQKGSDQEIDLYAYQIPAGFPSPAEDFIEKTLDLNDYLISNKSATFLVRVQGNSMINAGIHDGDMLVVDRSVEPTGGKIILGVLNGEFTVKRISRQGSKIYLEPENEKFNRIEITPEMNFTTWGVVTFAIHQIR
ncbi:MAG: translesion error-prone DNA polymerase V autoproteolytic subunit [Bacteroidales bacterium]|nr:translesion error-prone DNA polymerase V autoproteolytic subunit [Bacteroidales bacterium]